MRGALTLVLLCFISTSGYANYRPFSNAGIRSCSIQFVREPEFRVCLSGRVSESDYIRALNWSTESIFAWLKLFKKIDDQTTRAITYTCDSPHLTWHLMSGQGRSYASPRNINIYLSAPYGTWTHELGHALVGLGDTYAGSRAGNCQSGQPESLMCWGGYGPKSNKGEHSTLWDDDVRGGTYAHKVVFGESVPPDFADEINVVGPVNLLGPWQDGPVVNVVRDALNVSINDNWDETQIVYNDEFVGCAGFFP